MQKTLRALICCAALAVLPGTVHSQGTHVLTPHERELMAHFIVLRNDYLKASRDYKTSLERLLLLYQKGQKSAEMRFAQSKELFEKGLISIREYNDSKESLAEAASRIEDVHHQLEKVDADVAAAEAAPWPTAAQLLKDERDALRERRRARQPACQNWTLTASRHQGPHSVTTSFKLRCQY